MLIYGWRLPRGGVAKRRVCVAAPYRDNCNTEKENEPKRRCGDKAAPSRKKAASAECAEREEGRP